MRQWTEFTRAFLAFGLLFFAGINMLGGTVPLQNMIAVAVAIILFRGNK